MTAVDRQPFSSPDPYALHIGGRDLPVEARFEAIDPSTGEPWAEIAQASAEDVGQSVAAARRAFKSWRRSTPAQRQEALWRLADAVESDPDRWGRLLATENGRPIREATIADVPTCAAILRFFSGLTRDHRGYQIPVEDADSVIYTVREPLGVIAALIPWNSPIITLANKLGPALATGNTVVMKPSEFASPSVLEFARLAREVLPPGVLNVVTGFGPDVGAALVSHPDVAKISFTGGTATARKIMAAAGEVLTPAIMELGGKGALIICEDADIDAAVTDALTGIFLPNGEACIAASRLLVHERIHDAVRDPFAEIAGRIRVGDALGPETQFGPLVTRKHRDRVMNWIVRARSEGAKVIVGGDTPQLDHPLDGGFSSARRCSRTMTARRSSLAKRCSAQFTVLERFSNEQEAVERANATRYGLAAGVWTRDLARAHRLARRRNRLDQQVVRPACRGSHGRREGQRLWPRAEYRDHARVQLTQSRQRESLRSTTRVVGIACGMARADWSNYLDSVRRIWATVDVSHTS